VDTRGECADRVRRWLDLHRSDTPGFSHIVLTEMIQDEISVPQFYALVGSEHFDSTFATGLEPVCSCGKWLLPATSGAEGKRHGASTRQQT